MNFLIVNALDASVAQASGLIDLGQILGFAVSANITGSAAGLVSLEISNDPSPSDSNFVDLPVNWIPLANSESSITSANPYLINVRTAYYNWVRFLFTAETGTGTISSTFNTKESVT